MVGDEEREFIRDEKTYETHTHTHTTCTHTRSSRKAPFHQLENAITLFFLLVFIF
jgi:hypothetical protein